MRFHEAMKALEEGKNVRSKDWHKNAYVGPSKFIELPINTFLIAESDIFESFKSEWELFEEPEQLLNFAQVVEGLKQGKHYKRKSWPDGSRMFENEGFFIKDGAGTVLIKLEDVEATDWVEVT